MCSSHCDETFPPYALFLTASLLRDYEAIFIVVVSIGRCKRGT
jgi:hypothetical protein